MLLRQARLAFARPPDVGIFFLRDMTFKVSLSQLVYYLPS